MKKTLFILLLWPMCLGAQIVTTVAGNGTGGYGGDGAAAIDAQLKNPNSIAFDQHGNCYVSDGGNNRVRKISPSGTITTIAGNGGSGYSGDGGPATAATIEPTSIATDTLGNVYITENARIRKVSVAGIITTIAGTGTPGYNADNIPATDAQLRTPYLGFVDDSGAVFFSDSYNHRIRKIGTTGTITTIAGTGVSGSSGDGGPATDATMGEPAYICRNAKGELFVPDPSARRIRKIDMAGTITAFAGTGAGGTGGDGTPATAASTGSSYATACDDTGNIYICTPGARIVRMVDTFGIITRVAGAGTLGYSGDGGPALLAEFAYPGQAAVYHGDVYIADQYNHRIRKITYNAVSIEGTGNDARGLSLYPNPTTGWLTISAAKDIKTIALYTLAGQRVMASTNSPDGKQMSIDMSALAPGVYVAVVNEVYTCRIVKN